MLRVVFAQTSRHPWPWLILGANYRSMKLESIIDRANRCEMHAMGFQHPRPTRHSIAKINSHFDITLPQSLLEFVRCWRSSGCWLASLGPDYESGSHIIRINSYWRQRRRTRRIPSNLVIINRGFDDDLDCLDLTQFNPNTGEYAVRYWSPGIPDGEAYTSFPEYMDSQIRFWKSEKST